MNHSTTPKWTACRKAYIHRIERGVWYPHIRLRTKREPSVTRKWARVSGIVVKRERERCEEAEDEDEECEEDEEGEENREEVLIYSDIMSGWAPVSREVRLHYTGWRRRHSGSEDMVGDINSFGNHSNS